MLPTSDEDSSSGLAPEDRKCTGLRRRVRVFLKNTAQSDPETFPGEARLSWVRAALVTSFTPTLKATFVNENNTLLTIFQHKSMTKSY